MDVWQLVTLPPEPPTVQSCPEEPVSIPLPEVVIIPASPARGATPTLVVSGSADRQALSPGEGLRLCGYSVRESAATPAVATAILRHGTVDSAPPIAFISLAASGYEKFWFGDDGIEVPGGVFLERNSGSTEFALWFKE